MRKRHRLPPEQLAPYEWQMPRVRGRESGLRSQTADDAIGPPRTPAWIDWQTLFDNANPVEIEVGMGKGLFLLNAAFSRPETNFFGIEIVRKYQLYATTRFAIRELRNVRTVCADARWVFRQFVPEGSVAAVHVYFPDPWWKARHKKRRVFTAGFAADAARVLREGGRFLIASDVEEYFGVMTGILRRMTAFREVVSETSRGSVEEAGFRTNFERKARQKGTPVWRAEFERVSGAIADPADPTS
ncbi:MAG TPA: tRNA (guanosine(46)-N7)-methyltransferase TrmB [Gemmata sp.]|nr:tRNA (guanosine(46)-N7)-methyltransferase TrmB [Gemmata sp.]